MADATYMRTNVDEIPQMVTELRQNFYKTVPVSYEYRLNELNQLLKMYRENKDEILSELCKTFGTFGRKHTVMRLWLFETDLIDTINNLKTWMKSSEHYPQPLANSITWNCDVTPNPRGVVCIIAPWNYPIQLLLRPLIGAIAAGNAVICKPSEITDNISRLMFKLLNKYLDNKMVRVVCGGVPETSALLKEKFDFILFTGSPAVGKIVMRAASAHLTPVCLELGGKNPVFVDDACDLHTTTRRIIYGRFFFNAGQTCLCPEYVFISKSKVKEAIQLFRKHLIDMYITNDDSNTENKFSKSEHYEKIVNTMHCKRLNEIRQHYIKNEPSKIVIGSENKEDLEIFGKENIEDRYMPPMVLQIDKSEYDTDKVMEGEVFGPILTIIPMDGTSDEWKAEAVSLVRTKGEPLAAYVFSSRKGFVNYIHTNVAAGTVVANDCCYQAILKDVPFGGVGESGMGHYGGINSFVSFSHMRPLAARSHGGEFLNDIMDRYVPSNLERLETLANMGIRPRLKTTGSEIIKYTIGTAAVLGVAYAINEYYLNLNSADVTKGLESLKSLFNK